jgi:hypothetical protein
MEDGEKSRVAGWFKKYILGVDLMDGLGQVGGVIR